ncbi:MAG: LLM class flavin-dependent oxidoreductase [Gammaproteobacteria bacterium]|nr:LLM class flavin-dependent oxidoreductase [Gammaproteobacteria bacterium]
MKFGLFFLNLLGQDESSEQILERMLDTAQYADQSHFDQFAVYENHFSTNGVVGAPITVAGYLLGLTERIKVASLNQVITTHHPVRVAEEACLLDQMSEGRFILGFSDSEKTQDMTFFNRPTDSQQQIFEVCHEIIDEALKTGFCQTDNDFYSFPRISINPHPYTQGGPEQFVLATSESIVAWAAKRALPLIYKWDDSNERRQALAIRYRKTADEHGVDIENVRHRLTLIANKQDTEEAARNEVREYLSAYIREMHPDIDFETKMNQLLDENAIGVYQQAIDKGNMAMELCDASDVLWSFESMKDLDRRRAAMNLVNERIKSHHL